jgi:hypothetical protein
VQDKEREKMQMNIQLEGREEIVLRVDEESGVLYIESQEQSMVFTTDEVEILVKVLPIVAVCLYDANRRRKNDLKRKMVSK